MNTAKKSSIDMSPRSLSLFVDSVNILVTSTRKQDR